MWGIFFHHVKKQFSFSFSLRSNSASICFLVHSLQVVVESPVTSCQWQQTKINKRKFILFWFLRVSTQLLTNRWRHEILPLWTGDCFARIDAAMIIGLCLAIVLRTKEVAKLMCKKFRHNRSVTPDIIWNEKYRWFASLRIHLGRRAQIKLFYIIVQIICFNLLHQGEVWGLRQVHWTKKLFQKKSS